jgi:hypothetical protein
MKKKCEGAVRAGSGVSCVPFDATLDVQGGVMTRHTAGLIVTPALSLAIVLAAGAAPAGRTHDDGSATPRIAAAAAAPAPAAAQGKGRYKKNGDNCEWDANDTGPNQCTPAVKGRFKKDGDACRWDANDAGPDQCRPAGGRWKKDGDACKWESGDNGPDQCNPRAPRN